MKKQNFSKTLDWMVGVSGLYFFLFLLENMLWYSLEGASNEYPQQKFILKSKKI